MSRFRIGLLAAWVGFIPVLLAILAGVRQLIMPGMAGTASYDRWLDRNAFHGAFPWLWLVIVLIGALVIVSLPRYDVAQPDRYYGRTRQQRLPFSLAQRILGILMILGLLISLVGWTRTVWDSDKDEGRFYNKATRFYVPYTNAVPQSLSNLVREAHERDGCLVGGKSDVSNCVKLGEFSATGFEPRVSSAKGARIVMDRTSGDNQAVDLNADTLTYLNATADQPARWTAIRDGSGIRQPMEGVVEWTGTGLPTSCSFSGDHELNRALNGKRKNNLRNLFAERFPALYFVDSDVWGYCDDGQPVVVFPVIRQQPYKAQTVDVPAGIVTMRGSRSGNPDFNYQSKVSGLTGPVYPASVAASQRESTKWAAGREYMNRSHFGYDPASSEAQAGNVSEYLLRSKSDGHLYWVTPLTLRGSKSDLFVAYSMVRADEITGGRLNRQSVYVLAETDQRRINVDNLEASAKDYISIQQPGFFSSGGKLIEFTPTDGDIWRAFGELNGRVIYRLDISANNRIAPKLVALDSNAPTGKPQVATNTICGTETGKLTQAQLVNCLKQLTDELSRRTAGGSTTP